MAKNHKCIECVYCSRFCLPVAVTKDNVEYVRELLFFYKVENKIVCNYTMKTKLENHQQYCNHFKKASKDIQKINTKLFKKELEELKEKYEEYLKENGGIKWD